ncbi:hypothetical protein [Nonomuraea sp. B1E8]|uniref:hypothetical protein n=1 Tax=unclassified Nonomuraea TaxID=2593643 RepID=UPI00325E3332
MIADREGTSASRRERAEQVEQMREETPGSTEELQLAALTWRMRFSSVDFVNLPRIAMLASGTPIVNAARRVGLDTSKPFHGQGMAPGLFVADVRPLFETWNAEAVALDEHTLGGLRRGLLVSFETSMRCANPPELPPKAFTGDLSKDPYLFFRAGDRRVIVRFDPQWLTTTTAGSTLHSAARHPQIYSGLGQIVSVSENLIEVSSLVFGQPKLADQALGDYMASASLPIPRDLSPDDFRNEFSATEEVSLSANYSRERETMQRLNIVLIFDEDLIMPGEIDHTVLGQIVRVVPEFRRDLGIAVASLFPPRGVSPADLSAHLLAGRPSLWKTFTVPGLATLIKTHNLAVAVVTGVTQTQAANLDEAIREEASAYCGALELDRTLSMHRSLFAEDDRYHVVDSELRLRYSAFSRAVDEANDESLDEPLNKWLDEGFFRTVVWEEDKTRSAAEGREAALIMEAWLRDERGE